MNPRPRLQASNPGQLIPAMALWEVSLGVSGGCFRGDPWPSTRIFAGGGGGGSAGLQGSSKKPSGDELAEVTFSSFRRSVPGSAAVWEMPQNG